MFDVMPYCFSDRPRLDKLAPNLYRVDLCMPQAVGPTNSYIFKADGVHDNGRSLIIDTGANHYTTKAVFDEALAALDISWDDVDVLITHFHWDHCAGLTRIYRPTMTVYGGIDSIDKQGAPIMAARGFGSMERRTSAFFGIDDTFEAKYWYPMTLGCAKQVPLVVPEEGHVFCVGPYNLRVMHVPGHDMHQICLYDEAAQLFVAGDQVLYNQYTSVMIEEDIDQLGIMMHSLMRLRTVKASLVLCGHGNEGDSLSGRCQQTLDHFSRQLNAFYKVCLEHPDDHDPAHLAYWSTHTAHRRPWEDRPMFARRALLIQTMSFVKALMTAGKIPNDYPLLYARW